MSTKFFSVGIDLFHLLLFVDIAENMGEYGVLDSSQYSPDVGMSHTAQDQLPALHLLSCMDLDRLLNLTKLQSPGL